MLVLGLHGSLTAGVNVLVPSPVKPASESSRRCWGGGGKNLPLGPFYFPTNVFPTCRRTLRGHGTRWLDVIVGTRICFFQCPSELLVLWPPALGTRGELACYTEYARRTHLSVVKGKKPIVRKKSPMKAFSRNPMSPVAADGLRRALLCVPEESRSSNPSSPRQHHRCLCFEQKQPALLSHEIHKLICIRGIAGWPRITPAPRRTVGETLSGSEMGFTLFTLHQILAWS